MKKILLIGLMVCLGCFFLSGCGDDKLNDATSNSTAQPSATNGAATTNTPNPSNNSMTDDLEDGVDDAVNGTEDVVDDAGDAVKDTADDLLGGDDTTDNTNSNTKN